MRRESKIFHHKRLSDVVNVLKNVDNTSRPKLTKMKAHDLLLFSQLLLLNIAFFVVFTRYEPCLPNPLKSENEGDKGSSRSTAVNVANGSNLG